MGESMRDRLAASGVLHHVVLPTEIDLLLGELETDGAGPFAALDSTGRVTPATTVGQRPLPGIDLALALPPTGESLGYRLVHDGTSFRLWLELGTEGHVAPILALVQRATGLGLVGADRVQTGDVVELRPFPASDPRHRPSLVSRAEAGAVLTPCLLVSGDATAPAGIRFTPDTSTTQGVLALGLEPRSVVVGDTGLGFTLDALAFDDSTEAAAPGLVPAELPAGARAADPAWRGIVARGVELVLPPSVPLVGGRPITGYLEAGHAPAGVDLVLTGRLAHADGRPDAEVRVECNDPTATGLSGLVPTLVRVVLTFDRAGASPSAGTTVAFAAGHPVVATLTATRDPVRDPGAMTLAVGVTAQGPDGLFAVRSTALGPEKVFDIAAMAATALIAEDQLPQAPVGDAHGPLLTGLLAAGSALSGLFEHDTSFVLHGVEVSTTGHGLPLGGKLVALLDYTAAARIVHVGVDGLGVEMRRDQPMRIRVRQLRMALDPGERGLAMVALDYDQATVEVEDPGAWRVDGLTTCSRCCAADRAAGRRGWRSTSGSRPTWVRSPSPARPSAWSSTARRPAPSCAGSPPGWTSRGWSGAPGRSASAAGASPRTSRRRSCR
jgi:hypothetical protein